MQNRHQYMLFFRHSKYFTKKMISYFIVFMGVFAQLITQAAIVHDAPGIMPVNPIFTSQQHF